MDNLLNVPTFIDLQTTYNKLRWLIIFQEKVERVFKDHEDIRSHLLELTRDIKNTILIPPIKNTFTPDIESGSHSPYGVCSTNQNCLECFESCPLYSPFCK